MGKHRRSKVGLRDISDELLERMSAEVAEEINWDIISDMLIEQGWVRVVLLGSIPPYKKNDILDWLHVTCLTKFRQRGSEFLFKEEKDAVMFTLRWS